MLLQVIFCAVAFDLTWAKEENYTGAILSSNWALHKNAEHSSTWIGDDNYPHVKWQANKSVDGVAVQDFPYCSHTNPNNNTQHWWRVDLVNIVKVDWVNITNRILPLGKRLKTFRIIPKNDTDSQNVTCGEHNFDSEKHKWMMFHCGEYARYLEIQVVEWNQVYNMDQCSLTLCEVEIYSELISPPEISMEPAGPHVASGTPVQLRCRSLNGSAPLGYSLLRDGLPVATAWASEPGPARFHLTVSGETAGEYRCQVRGEKHAQQVNGTNSLTLAVASDKLKVFVIMAGMTAFLIIIFVIICCYVRHPKGEAKVPCNQQIIVEGWCEDNQRNPNSSADEVESEVNYAQVQFTRTPKNAEDGPKVNLNTDEIMYAALDFKTTS
ncbi:uncharacterized protein LOC116946086 isoform X2 [Petromyzon marinus]|uniref:Uncharacterized protein LOC116946086 isoform X2 n=1 Tax=Petromyzon marinus TaxID=7757 RepID=A0AAJ7X0B5_PETMA|nr:uncharacterized protein LOC116946086 isoform X2 [Petromyzon marinus]